MTAAAPVDHTLAARLKKEIEGEVLFDRASRGRYSTDASIYQIEPVGVVIPKTQADVEKRLADTTIDRKDWYLSMKKLS